MKQPDFIIGGATRSGISTLTHILDHHPQVFIPHLKEHQFFMQSDFSSNRISSLCDPFADAVNISSGGPISRNKVLHGEKEFDPERAHEGCPNAKVIFTLRNPVERAYVQFYHALSDKKETVRTFEHAMEAELSGLRSPETTGRCWIYKNQYQTHLDHWLSFYSKDDILILIYEEWTDPMSGSLDVLEEFLGLEIGSLMENHGDESFDPQQKIESLREDYPKKFPALSDATKEQLEDIFSIDKTFITNILGRDIPSWNRY